MVRSQVFVVLCLTLFVASGARAQKRVYLTKEKALEKVFGQVDSVRRVSLSLTAKEVSILEDELDMIVLDRDYVFYEAIDDSNVTKRAVIMNVMGQHQPITFIVGIWPDGVVARVEIMVYRESRGAEVRRRAFLRQFEDKTRENSLSLNDDITNITGATISSRNVTSGVRLALELHGRMASRAPSVGDEP